MTRTRLLEHFSTWVPEGAELTDAQLLERCIDRRDENAFAALVRRHGPMVWGVCRRLLDHHDAEDAFQATFVVLVRKAASVSPRELVGNWLYGVARQAALCARRTIARRRLKERQVADMPDCFGTSHSQDELRHLLDLELSRLANKYRAVVVLCDLEGKTRKEAARQLGVPEGTVAGWLARARTRLAKQLARHGLALSGGTIAALLAQHVAACVPAGVAASAINTVRLLAKARPGSARLISASVATLAKGVLKTMLLSKLLTVSAVLFAVGLFSAGLAVGLAQCLPGTSAPAIQQGSGAAQLSEPRPSGGDDPKAAPNVLRRDPPRNAEPAQTGEGKVSPARPSDPPRASGPVEQGSFRGQDVPVDAAELVGAVIKAMQGTDWENFNRPFSALQRLIQSGQATGEAAAKKLLARQADITAEPAIDKLLNELVNQKKPRLAAELLLNIASSRHRVAAYKKGHVVVGRVVVEGGKLDPELILAQMPILAEGYFAGEVGDLERPICFRAQGYANVDISLKGKPAGVFHLGTVRLKALPAGQAGTLKGRVALDAVKDDATQERAAPTVRISMMVGPANTPHNGFAPRRRWPDSINDPVAKDGSFTVSGLSPVEYYLMIEAKGHTDFNKPVTIAAGKVQDAGTITLRSNDLGFYIGTPAPKTGELAWEKDYLTAMKKAQAEKKPVLVMMTATWCGPCKMLEKETLNDPWVRHFLAGFIVVKAYEDKQVEKTYGLNGYPTLVFTDSNGKAMHRTIGYQATLPFAVECVRAHEQLNLKLPAELQTLVDKKVLPVGWRGVP